MLKLEILFDEFESQIIQFEKSIIDLYKLKISSPDELRDLIKNLYLLDDTITSFLQNSFSSGENRYQKLYRSKALKIFNSNPIENNLRRIEDGIKKLMPDRKEMLKEIRCYVKVGDVLREKVDIDSRSNLPMNEILNLVLEKLNELYDDFAYSIKEILIGNGINFKRIDFDSEIITLLENRGFIESIKYLGGNEARITPEGVLYVENFIKARIKLSEEKRKYINGSEDLTRKKEQLKADLAENEIKDILKELQYLLKNSSKLRNNLTLVSGRFFQNQIHEINKTLSNDELTIEYNRIRDAILKIIDLIADKDIK